MAGLVAAARAHEAGARVLVLEKAEWPGGSMRLSSGVIWRYRDLATFREQCPGGDPALQTLVLDRLDRDLAWLRGLGVPSEPWTENPLTVGARFDVDGLTETLAARIAQLRLGEPLAALPDGVPVVLATGGFAASRDLVRRFVTAEADNLWVRANPHSSGDGLRLALDAGAVLTAGMGEFYGRSLPAPPAVVTADRFVSLSQLYARHATVEALDGDVYPPASVAWHESDVAQWISRKPGARAWYAVAADHLGLPAGRGTVADAIAAAQASGADVVQRGGQTAVLVAPGITSTLGGLRVDCDTRVVGESGEPLAGLYAAGSDVGGVSTGGYSSGLAAALVLGRVAAERALGL